MSLLHRLTSTFLLCTLTLTMSLVSNQAHAAQSFEEVLAKVQDSNWSGEFDLNALGVLHCSGPLDVHFFPAQVEDFSGGATTVSYRHDADFSGNRSVLCRTLGKRLSVVKTGKCGESFPTKFNPSENKRVPFRTIIPRGEQAFVNSPSCTRHGEVKRDELEVVKMDLSNDDNRLDLTIRIAVDLKFRTLIVDLNYVLLRQ